MGADWLPRSQSRVMKQVLLRVSAVFAEIGLGKVPQLLRRHFLSMRKIALSQNPLDPHVDRECAEPLVGKKHHTICDLRPNAGQRAQFLPKTSNRKSRRCYQYTF